MSEHTDLIRHYADLCKRDGDPDTATAMRAAADAMEKAERERDGALDVLRMLVDADVLAECREESGGLATLDHAITEAKRILWRDKD